MPANPAGLFNFVAKCATDLLLHRLTVGSSSGNHKVAGDFSGSLDRGDRLRYRLSLLDDEGGRLRQRQQGAPPAF
ncbi:TonB-dependent receptor|nr:TonB-dependent receptor [Candidatus Pantoea persica]